MEPKWSHSHTSQSQAGTQIDEGLRSYMLRVYNYMAMGVALTGVVVLLMANMPGLMQTLALGPGKWVVFIALLGMGFLSPKIMTMQNDALAQLFYWTYCALWGVLISPLVVAFLQVEGGVADVARAFFITAGMFLGTSLFGYTTKKDLTAFGQFCVMAVIGALLVGIGAMLFGGYSETFSLGFSFVVILLFAGMTAYETQMIKDMYTHNAGAGAQAIGRMAVYGALMIYGNFVVMFIHVLNILGIMRD